MQSSNHPAIEDEAGVAASSTTEMDVDLTPPKKRINSGQSSRRASAERWEDDHVADKVEAAGVGALKVENDIDDATSVLEATPLREAASSATIKSEPSPAEAYSTAPTPPSDTTTTPQPSAKKKKTSTSVKKESSSFNNTPKPKKSSSSSSSSTTTKKTTSTHADSSSSRSKPKLPTPPPPSAPADDDEDNNLYCTCQRRQDDVEGGMIMCDRCDQWYHYRCMGITEDDAELVDQFICPPCHGVTGQQTTYKTACARVECRRAATTPFSKYCSERCGVLRITARMAALKVDKRATEVLERDGRVAVARKMEGFTKREAGFEGVWEKVVREELAPARSMGLAEAYAVLSKEEAEQPNGSPNGAAQSVPHGTSSASLTQPESSSTSLLAIDEQHTLITHHLSALDLSKARLNSRLDRLDLRSTLLHLVSDRVPTLAPIGTSTTDPEEVDEEMPEQSKKKKKSKSKSTPSSDTSGPRCGYDQRLHWDDATFDAWARTSPGSQILAHDTPLDGALDDAEQDGVVCALAKRKCRRHVDWSNLCELALDAEKASLNADSRVLTQQKLALVDKMARLEVERETVKELIDKQEARERRRREERDRDVAMRMASEGTRRGV